MCWVGDAGYGSEAVRLRRELVAFLRAYGRSDGDFGAAELILGELLSNAGRYTPGPVCVSIDWTRKLPRAAVSDAGRGFTWAPELPRTMADRGRGLYIVEALAADVRVEADDTGCRVLATLPVPIADGAFAPTPCPRLRPAEAPGVCPDPRAKITARLAETM